MQRGFVKKLPTFSIIGALTYRDILCILMVDYLITEYCENAMNSIEQYARTENCHVGNVEGYGYAFVPGNAAGVVLLDARSKEVLEDLSRFQAGRDEERIELFLKNGLIRSKLDTVRHHSIDTGKVKSIGVWLHVSNTCNLDCPGCYIANKGREKMSIRVAGNFLNSLEATVAKHKLTTIGMRLAGGEPTTNKEVVYFVVNEVEKRFAAKGIKTRLSVITNGTLLTDEFLRFLVRNKIGLSVSLDGTQEWNDKIRFFKNGRGAFNAIYRGVQLCKEYELSPYILSTITEENLGGVEDLGEFFVNLNLSFRFGLHRDNRGDYNGYRKYIETLIRSLGNFYAYYAEEIRSGRTTMKHNLSDIHFDRKPHMRACNVGYSGVTVSHTGEVFLCQAAMDQAPIGHIRDKQSLLEMAWSQKTLPELAHATASDYSGCNNCQWLRLCAGGCPLVNANANGVATSQSPYCEVFKWAIPEMIKLKALSNINKLKLASQKGE